MAKTTDRILIKGGTLLTPDKIVTSGCLLIEGGRIVALGQEMRVKGVQVIDARGMVIAPGFVDIHVHGSVDHDTMDATPESLEAMARFFASHGVTSFLPTTITAPRHKILAAIEAVSSWSGTEDGAEALGVHMEGPHINVKKAGAQPAQYVRPAEPTEYQLFFAKNVIKLVTLAVEIPENKALIAYALKRGARVAIGHSVATYDEVVESVSLGLTHATHTFNSMGRLDHRAPGTVGAVLDCDEITADVIADNIHVHPSMVRLLVKAKGIERVVLVTDAIRAAGMPDGLYDLGGQEVAVQNGIARTKQGSLAGSTLTMDKAVRNLMKAADLSLPLALQMATCNPARVVGVNDRKGTLSPGKDADILLLDDDHSVALTMVKGRVVYRARESDDL